MDCIIEKLVARHTITIEFLAHLAKTKHWTIEELRKELEQNGFQLEYKDEEDKLINIQQSYETLYDLSKLTDEEQNILEAFSVFPYLPLSVKVCNQWLLSDAGVEEKEDILEGLYRKGWLQFDMEQDVKKADFIFELAYLLQYIADYKKAEKLYEQSLEIYKRELGENHPDTARSYNNLAMLYYNQGGYKIALVYYLKAYNIFAFKLGLQHPNTQIVYKNMEITYSEWKPKDNFKQ